MPAVYVLRVNWCIKKCRYANAKNPQMMTMDFERESEQIWGRREHEHVHIHIQYI